MGSASDSDAKSLSGPSAVDKYLQNEFDGILGMSGRFSAGIVSAILQMQTSAGLTGDIGEIGVFEGRFLIAMALSMSGDERAVALDTWNWPDSGVRSRFVKNLRSFGLVDRVEILDAKNSHHDISREPGLKHRLIHIDADHTYESLSKDLVLAFRSIDPRGIICVDDMLNPAYPELYDAVRDVLVKAPDWRVHCILDRENIVASSKYLICDRRMFDFYNNWLIQRYPHFIWRMGARFKSHMALVLAPEPILAKVRS